MVEHKRNNKGFTFVELILAVAILSIIMVSIVHFMTTTSTVYSRSNRDNEVQSMAQDVYEQVYSCLMQANKVILIGKAKKADGTYNSQKTYVSDSMEPIAADVSRVSRTTGSLCNDNEKELQYSVNIITPAGIPNAYPPAPLYAFRSLKKDDGSGTDALTEIKVDALYVEYETKTGTDYETCYVTFYYDDLNSKLYLNRHYESDKTASPQYFTTSNLGAVIDHHKDSDDANLLCKSIDTDGFRVVVDAENGGIGLILEFDNYSLTYESQGMVKVRNKNVLTR